MIMSCMVNRSGALVGEAFSVVGEPFVDPEVEPNFLLMVLIVMLLLAFLKRLGCQFCVDHLGITAMAFVLSLQIFVVTFHSKLKVRRYNKIQCSILWKSINC